MIVIDSLHNVKTEIKSNLLLTRITRPMLGRYRRRAGAGSGLVFPMADLAPAPTSLFPAPVLVGRVIAFSPNFDLE